jgi:hypothetical protein
VSLSRRSSRSARGQPRRRRRPTRDRLLEHVASSDTSTRPRVSPSRSSGRVAVVQRRRARGARPGRAGASPRSSRTAPSRSPTARSHPPAWTEASCPGSPIAITFAPTFAAFASSCSLCRVAAMPASSNTTTHRSAVVAERRSRARDCRASATDPRLLGQLARRAAGRRDTDHGVAGLLVELAQHAGGVGLAGPGERLDHVHPLPEPATARTAAACPAFNVRSPGDRALDRALVELRDALAWARPVARRSAPPRADELRARERPRGSSRARRRAGEPIACARTVIDARALRPAAANSRNTAGSSNVFARSVNPPAREQLGELALPHSLPACSSCALPASSPRCSASAAALLRSAR